MMASTSKRKSEALLIPAGVSEEPSAKKLSRRLRYNKKKQLKWEKKQAKISHKPEKDIPSLAIPPASLNIVFDPSRVYIFFLS